MTRILTSAPVGRGHAGFAGGSKQEIDGLNPTRDIKAEFRPWLLEVGRSDRELPEIAGTYQGKNLVICGDAACVWEDLERLGCRVDIGRGRVDGPYDFMTVNKIVELFPGNIEHAYSNEWPLLEKFIAGRRSEYLREFKGPVHTHGRGNSGAKWSWPITGPGTSGMGAAVIGVALGYDQAILCGMPLTDIPHNGEPHWRKCKFTQEAADNVESGINRYWKLARDMVFKGRVKSMSGRTKDWLGAP